MFGMRGIEDESEDQHQQTKYNGIIGDYRLHEPKVEK
jgi:hypothetical protein